jgi:hypothetical protein
MLICDTIKSCNSGDIFSVNADFQDAWLVFGSHE